MCDIQVKRCVQKRKPAIQFKTAFYAQFLRGTSESQSVKYCGDEMVTNDHTINENRTHALPAQHP
jgi:hypothetical protein